MKTTKIYALAAILCVGFTLTGCEDEYCMAQWLLPDGNDHGSSSSASKGDVSGTWSGRAGTGQTRTILHLYQNDGLLSGSWTWGAGDTRTCSGSASGNAVTLKDNRSDGDTWYLTISSDGANLSGFGLKYGGGKYNVSFGR